ncbi:hypothetical protein JT358_15975 [Micrococcales bacterium 31B]|nr:hypothetical protein [Micrococcales bacterium 31B]
MSAESPPFAWGETRIVKVTLSHKGSYPVFASTLSATLPEGWSAEPVTLPWLSQNTVTVDLKVTAPASVETGTVPLELTLTDANGPQAFADLTLNTRATGNAQVYKTATSDTLCRIFGYEDTSRAVPLTYEGFAPSRHAVRRAL